MALKPVCFRAIIWQRRADFAKYYSDFYTLEQKIKMNDLLYGFQFLRRTAIYFPEKLASSYFADLASQRL